jgi:hypothetical protein
MRTIPHPVYTLSPDGKTGCAPDFRRIQDMRPGYGYCGLPDPNKDILAPKDSGIVRVDLESGKAELIVSLAQMAAIPHEHGDISQAKHYFNHLLINTDGTRLEFLNRWRMEEKRGFGTRMVTCNMDGSNLYVLDPHGRTSHFIWKDPAHILGWICKTCCRRVSPTGAALHNAELSRLGNVRRTLDRTKQCNASSGLESYNR